MLCSQPGEKMPNLPRAGKKKREWGCNMKFEVEDNKCLYTLMGFKQGQGGKIKTVSDPHPTLSLGRGIKMTWHRAPLEV